MSVTATSREEVAQAVGEYLLREASEIENPTARGPELTPAQAAFLSRRAPNPTEAARARLLARGADYLRTLSPDDARLTAISAAVELEDGEYVPSDKQKLIIDTFGGKGISTATTSAVAELVDALAQEAGWQPPAPPEPEPEPETLEQRLDRIERTLSDLAEAVATQEKPRRAKAKP